ncbi:MAG: hypothetical protein MRY74_08770 [Neomegalonema sp.]|nr:hypothetical protein [Neomegalonema sp.]
MSRAFKIRAALLSMTRRAIASSLAVASLFAAPAAFEAGGAAAKTFLIGGKAYTEQYVLAEVTRQLLAREGIKSRVRVGYSTEQIRKAQLTGRLDITWDYTWTGYAVHHKQSAYKTTDDVMKYLREADAKNGLVWLARSNVNNTFAFAVNLDFAAEACIHSMKDLAEALRNGVKLRLASDQECHKREDCLLRAQSSYSFKFPKSQIKVMNVAETSEALRERRAEVAIVYATDGKIPAYDLEVLEDTEKVFTEHYIVPVVRADALKAEPKLRAILEKISRALDTATSQDLHYRVDVIGQPIPAVATYFITSKGL